MKRLLFKVGTFSVNLKVIYILFIVFYDDRVLTVFVIELRIIFISLNKSDSAIL